MRIGIDIRPTLKKRTGIGRYTLSLVNALLEIDKENQYFLYCKKGFFSRSKKIPEIKGAKICIDRFNRGPKEVLPGLDVFFSPCTDFLVPPNGSKLVAVVHDLIFKARPEDYSQEELENADNQIKRILEKADTIICDSRNTQDDLCKNYEVNKKTDVVYLGVDRERFSSIPERDLSFLGIKKPYILYVGTMERRKNVRGLLEAYIKLKERKNIEHSLVFVGNFSHHFTKEDLFEGIDQDNIFVTGFVEDALLVNLYKQADIFVYPSLYEGFGLPIIEAFAAGLSVITSNTSSCAEIAGSAAICIDPKDIDEISQKMELLIYDEDLKMELKNKAYQRAENFSWKKTAENTLKVLEGVVE